MIQQQVSYQVPVVPFPPGVARLNYTPVRCNLPFPAPLQAVTEPLPDVAREYERMAKTQELKQKEVIVATKPRGTGLFSSIGAVLDEVTVQVQKGFHEVANEVDRSIRSQNFEAAQRNFFNMFRMPTEPLWRGNT
eukprot:TRINITY_DN4262_c0_g1_i1.p1 TRINITY_DN4262_c0_g1~~TRINITY_DN4262_c0_g1_i1.p1  ORF type:complete len:135 (+),score=28.64 TRINITY_DN4262_c0_g1_i1:3-407(+)